MPITNKIRGSQLHRLLKTKTPSLTAFSAPASASTTIPLSFTLKPFSAEAVKLIINGRLQRQGVDYSISLTNPLSLTATITWLGTFAIIPSMVIFADYYTHDDQLGT